MATNAKIEVSIKVMDGWNDQLVSEVHSTVVTIDNLQEEVGLAVRKAQNDFDRILDARRKLDIELASGASTAELTA